MGQGLERTWLFLSGTRGTLWVSKPRCGFICSRPHTGTWNGDDRPAIRMSALRLGPHIRFTGEPGFAPASVWLPVLLTVDSRTCTPTEEEEAGLAPLALELSRVYSRQDKGPWSPLSRAGLGRDGQSLPPYTPLSHHLPARHQASWPALKYVIT